jgi:hypothetical protein
MAQAAAVVVVGMETLGEVTVVRVPRMAVVAAVVVVVLLTMVVVATVVKASSSSLTHRRHPLLLASSVCVAVSTCVGAWSWVA